MPYTTITHQNQAAAQYQQAINQQGFSGLSGGSLGSLYNGGMQAQSIYGGVGGIVNITFTDANGVQVNLAVDQSCAIILDQISAHHAVRIRGYPPTPMTGSAPVSFQMVDGDFSIDELEKAENIIAELECEAS